MSFNFMHIVGAVIVVSVIVGIVRQALETRRAKAALASPDATALVRGEDGLCLTDVDGIPLFVQEIPLVPGPHRLTFQVSKMGGVANLPPVQVVVAEGLNYVEWHGTEARNMNVWMGETRLIERGVPVSA